MSSHFNEALAAFVAVMSSIDEAFYKFVYGQDMTLRGDTLYPPLSLWFKAWIREAFAHEDRSSFVRRPSSIITFQEEHLSDSR